MAMKMHKENSSGSAREKAADYHQKLEPQVVQAAVSFPWFIKHFLT
jgi:hypothetical protein